MRKKDYTQFEELRQSIISDHMARLQKEGITGFASKTEDPFKDVPDIYHRTNIDRFSGKFKNKRQMWLSDGSLLCYEYYTRYTVFGTYFDEQYRITTCDSGVLFLDLRKYLELNIYGVLYPKIPIYDQNKGVAIIESQADIIPIGMPYQIEITTTTTPTTTTTAAPLLKLFDASYFGIDEE